MTSRAFLQLKIIHTNNRLLLRDASFIHWSFIKRNLIARKVQPYESRKFIFPVNAPYPDHTTNHFIIKSLIFLWWIVSYKNPTSLIVDSRRCTNYDYYKPHIHTRQFVNIMKIPLINKMMSIQLQKNYRSFLSSLGQISHSFGH